MICRSAKGEVKLRQFFEESYCPLKLVGSRCRTFLAYETAMRRFESFDRSIPLAKIDSRHMAAWIASLLETLAPASVNCYVRHIMAILRFAEEEGVLKRTPRVKKLREPVRVPLAFTKEEFVSVLTASASAIGERGKSTIGGLSACDWWHSLLCVAWETGLRIGGLLAVRVQDVLLHQSGLYSRAEDQKDHEADWFPLSSWTCESLRKLIADHPNRLYVWPRRWTIATIERRFRMILDASGIYAPRGACLAFHRLRKSTASYVAAAGGDAQRKLCHSSKKTTEHYLDPRIVRSVRCLDVVPAPATL